MVKVVLNTLHTYNRSIQVSIRNKTDAKCLDNNTAEDSSTKVISSELYKKVCKILCNTDITSNDTLKQSYNEAYKSYKSYIDNSKMILKALGEDEKYIRQKINDMKSNLVYDRMTGNVYDKRYLDAEYR